MESVPNSSWLCSLSRGFNWHNFSQGNIGTASLPAHCTDMVSRWLAQTCDSIDMFNVVMIADSLKKQFHQEADMMVRRILFHDLLRHPDDHREY